MKNKLMLVLLALVFFPLQGVQAEEMHLVPIADCNIKVTAPDTNTGKGEALYIGLNSGEGTPGMRALIKFDLNAIPADARIKMAVLKLVPYTAKGMRYQSGGPRMGLYRMLVDWTEGGATWVNRDSTHKWNKAGVDGIGTDRLEEPVVGEDDEESNRIFDVTADVQAWQKDNGKTNYGWFIMSECDEKSAYAGKGLYDSFFSRESSSETRPTLTVIY